MKRRFSVMAATVTMVAAMAANSLSALAAPKTMPDGNIFDAEFYAATYPDVAAVCGNNEALLYQHYVLCGKAEGRLPYAQGAAAPAAASVGGGVRTMPDGGKFDPAYYAATYPDIKAALGTDANVLYAHYVNCGKAEGRRPYAPGSVAVNYATTSLREIKPYESKGSGVQFFTEGRSISDCYTDLYGNKYQTALRGLTYKSPYTGEQYLRYYLNGQYNRFQATVVGCSLLQIKNPDTAGSVKIVADGRVLFSDERINTQTRPYKINLDLTGVQDLKIEMYAAEGLYGIDVMLGDPVLLKEVP